MNNFLIVGKYLDQPKLVGKFSQAVPAILVAGGVAFTTNNVLKTPQKEKRKELIANVSILTSTIGSALLATRGMGKIKFGSKILFKGFEGLSKQINLNELALENTELANNFLSKNKVSPKISDLIQKAKTKILKFSELKKMYEELYPQKNGREFLNKLIPDPENINSKHIFGEIKRLSLVGLVPVVGGITGGILGDKLTGKNWKKRIPDKIKEGAYQYLANIFLCNIGAGAALAMLEKAKKTSKSARATGMLAGIFAVGVIGGSSIANLIGKICIDPILFYGRKKNHSDKKQNNFKELYSERKPDLLDIGLHSDDIATVAVLSGLKWVEPALPILYSISGYRAGIGYRN